MHKEKTLPTKETYNPKSIEEKWKEVWDEKQLYKVDLNLAKKPFYNLMMFPYPSAEGLHVGNMYAFAGADIYGRFKRMQGYDVFEPIGLDGFGIHSENYALKVGRTPQEHARISEKNFYRQLHSIGNSFDWSRKVETYDPGYYKWTQWLFIELFKAGLAYRQKAPVNYCPSCKTVLADEQVINGKCERCGTVVEKRNLEQWFFEITKYAERLLQNIEKLDWSEKVKIAQKNWIGKKEGAEIEFRLKTYDLGLTIFTTRPDTLYGATFLVVAPEYPLVKQIVEKKIQVPEKTLLDVEDYVRSSMAKSEQERVVEGKEKTGVFSGLYATHPLTQEKLPVWIADYVLMNYGTGAIMAVPAHDERDFAFAKKYDLPIKQVVAEETGITQKNETRRDGGCAVIFDAESQKYAVATSSDGLIRLFSGGVEDSEDLEKGVLREVTEETGLYDFKHVEKIQTCFAHFYNKRKDVQRVGMASCFLVILKSKKEKDKKLEPHEVDLHLSWLSPSEILENWNSHNIKNELDHWITFLQQSVAHAIELGYDKVSNKKLFKPAIYTGSGIIINSGEWNGWKTPGEMGKVLKDIEEKRIGKREAKYHLRDWLISRQRYWGPPIPMVYCETCAEKGESWFTTEEAKKEQELGIKNQESRNKIHNSKFVIPNSRMAGWFPVPEEQLPVLLPQLDDWKPTGDGKGPLAKLPDWVNVTCPNCSKPAKRETDVSDSFLDSSWYFFRYLATDRDDIPFPSKKLELSKTKKESNSNKNISNLKLKIRNSAKRLAWLPVAMYTGGAEHSVLHLLYSRFVTMVLYDKSMIEFEEPFTRFYAHGLVIKDGAKMSKSKGNVIVPDEYINKYGSDTLRTYLMFLGPFSQGGDFRDSGIEGMHKFLKRVWTFFKKFQISNFKLPISNKERLSRMHKTIKAVSEDMEALRFNTAIAHLMEYYNYLSEEKEISHQEAEVYIKLLAPFAPSLSEELWQEYQSGEHAVSGVEEFNSVHFESWPDFDEKYIVQDEVVIAVQVNGKLRDSIKYKVASIQDKETIEKMASESEKVKKYLEGKDIKKVIYIPGKVINFVIG